MVTRELNISPVGRVEGDLDVNVYMDRANGRRHGVTSCIASGSMLWVTSRGGDVDNFVFRFKAK